MPFSGTSILGEMNLPGEARVLGGDANCERLAVPLDTQTTRGQRLGLEIGLLKSLVYR